MNLSGLDAGFFGQSKGFSKNLEATQDYRVADKLKSRRCNVSGEHALKWDTEICLTFLQITSEVDDLAAHSGN